MNPYIRILSRHFGQSAAISPVRQSMRKHSLFSHRVPLVGVLAYCMISVSGFAADGADPLLQEAATAMVESDFERAESLARQALEQAASEDKSAARNILGMVLGQAGQYDDAIALFKENAEADPDDVGSFANWGESLRRAKRPQEAVVPLKKAIELRPDSTLYQLKLRLARIESGEDEAVGQETILKLQESPPPADWLITAVAIALHRENWQEGKTLLEQAQAVLDPQIYGELMQDFAFAPHKDRPELRGLFPTSKRLVVPAGPLTMEALAAYMEGHHDQALGLLVQAVAAGEPIGHISNLRGGIYMGKGDFAQAAEAFRVAGENSPEEPGVYLNYGEALRGVGNPATAAAVFQEGLQINPGNETLAVKLAFALVEAGQGLEVLDTGLKDARTGPLLVGRAAAAASQELPDVAARLLAEAQSLLSKEAFRGLLQDPVFKPYRDSKELSRFWDNQ